MSKEFIDANVLECKMLLWPITIMSAGGNILVTQRRKQQVLMICDNTYYVDLFMIPMKDIAVILGMDWLSYHGAQIDCGENTVALRGPNGD